ncbi:MAG: DUF1778 domain-containing protein [Planctomycetes bacterium]|nr:DUF1778 domain-containing protein [Planctomycetota bacterium]
MESRSAKTARLEARITPEQKELIERAAAYQGRTVSDFIVQTVHEAAKAVIEESEILRLNAAQSKAFVESLLAPPVPTDALRQAQEEYRRDVVSK